MQNIKELREKLIENYKLLENNERNIKLSKELVNTACKIISSCCLEHDYNKHMDNRKSISFLEISLSLLKQNSYIGLHDWSTVETNSKSLIIFFFNSILLAL